MNKAETLALNAQGKEAWNAWAARMLAEKKALEEKGEWSDSWPRNDATEAWLYSAQADFRGHNFTERADFSGFVFPGFADFGPGREKDETTKDISVPTRFEKHAAFIGAKFAGEASFGAATFSGAAGFTGATFSENTSFDRATFSGDVSFYNTTFSRHAGFYKAKFMWDARFEEAKFLGSAQFGESMFLRVAWFLKGYFMDAAFDAARFESYTTFESAHFEKAASFRAMQGESYFSLRGAIFDEAPNFEQAHFSEAPMLDDSRFPSEALADTTARWRALKRLAVQGHDHEREQLFFAQEIKSLRGETDWPLRLQNLFREGEPVWRNGARWWFGWAYQIFSDFGRSMVRPVLWWLGFAALFALVYLDRHFPYKAQPYPPGLMFWNASGHAPPLECVKGAASGPLASAIFLAIHKGSVAGLGGSEKLAQTYACLYGEERGAPIIPDAVAFMGMAQTLLSAPLIFLFLLAVRNHFRIK